MKRLLLIALLVVFACEDKEEPRDCAGVAGGTATVDNCDDCVGGNTGEVACTQDCVDVWGGNATIDSCDVCDDNIYNDCIQDCAGEWGGESFDCGGGCDENIQIFGECYNIELTTHIEFHDGRQGSILPEISNLVNLQRLIIHSNQLSGEIPSEIGNLVNLTHLELNNNNLSGEIPVEIFNPTNLEIVSVSNNQLSGEITSELIEAVKNLSFIGFRLWLSDNQLSGVIPEEMCDLQDNVIWYLINNSFCPPYPSCFEEWDIGEQNTTNCD
jgi:hypothetical protein